MSTHFTITDSNGQDQGEEIAQFVNLLRLPEIAPDRYSLLLVLQLYGGFKARTQNYNKVIREIEALEGNRHASKFKPPIQNKHPPLKGLWHKHYMQDGIASMARNLKQGIKRNGIPIFEQRMREATATGEERYVTAEDISAIVADAVAGNWERQSNQQALTGEWLLFAKHEGKNYYLSLATHDRASHEEVRAQINLICCREFPFLNALLDG